MPAARALYQVIPLVHGLCLSFDKKRLLKVAGPVPGTRRLLVAMAEDESLFDSAALT